MFGYRFFDEKMIIKNIKTLFEEGIHKNETKYDGYEGDEFV